MERELEGEFERQIDDLARLMSPYRLQMTLKIKSRLHRFASELARWNRRCGLLSPGDVPSVVRKHIGASLGILLLVDEHSDALWADVGSGGGFPGLVVKIWNPDQGIVLIEGSRRKCVFMQRMVRDLDLGQMTVLPMRAETMLARGEMVGAAQVLFARAVADISGTLVNFGPLVSEGGRILTFKGPTWRADVERANSRGLLGNGMFELETVLAIPWATGRILTIRKGHAS